MVGVTVVTVKMGYKVPSSAAAESVLGFDYMIFSFVRMPVE